MTDTEKLFVGFVGTHAESGMPKQEKAWRIRAFYKGQWRATSQGFARKQDAETALKALIDAGYDTPQKAIDGISGKLRNEIMCGSLAW